MLMEVKNNFKYMKNAIICNLKSAIEYKKSFITQTVFMFINNGFFLIFWNVVFKISDNQTGDIKMNTILYLWSITTIAYGISEFIFGGIENIGKFIVNGLLDSYLVQPKNIFISIATSKCNFSAFGDLMYGIVIGIIISNNICGLLIIFAYSIIGSIIMICTMTIIRSMAVYIGDIDEIAERYEHTLLINFTLYPEEIFGKVTKIFLYTIIPVEYIGYLPARLISEFKLYQLILLIFVTIIFIILAKIIFKNAIKNYESSNTMNLKE